MSKAVARAAEGLGSSVIARSEATKQSSFAAPGEKLDCFAALAMTRRSAHNHGRGYP
jgi:hypothetical protein